MIDSRYLFVYGTLRRAFDNQYAKLLRECSRFAGEGAITAALYQLDGFTGMVPDPESGAPIQGEAFEIQDPDRLWPVLDEYEGAEFELRIVPVTLTDGLVLQSFVYAFRGDVTGRPRLN